MITNNSICTIKQVNDSITLSHRTNSPTMFPIQRLNDKEYLVKSSGEIREYNTSNHLNPKSYKRMCVKLRDLIIHNFTNDDTKLVTLTYATPQKRGDQVQKHLTNYFKSIRTKHEFDYITVIEPHKNGSFHAHIMMKFNSTPAKNKFLKEKWKHGHAKVEKVRNINALAHYFTSEQKANRLHFYPPNFKIYRKSSGVISPTTQKMTKEQFINEYDVIKTNSYTKVITDSSDQILNKITKEYYKIQGEN